MPAKQSLLTTHDKGYHGDDEDVFKAKENAPSD